MQSVVAQRTINATQHCELTVARYMLDCKRLVHQAYKCPIETGLSKPCCYWCHQYLQNLNNLISRPAGLQVIYQGQAAKELTDHLYRIVWAEQTHHPAEMFTFSFERIEGQVTIRWEGVEQWPMLEQIKELDRLRREVIALV